MPTEDPITQEGEEAFKAFYKPNQCKYLYETNPDPVKVKLWMNGWSKAFASQAAEWANQ